MMKSINEVARRHSGRQETEGGGPGRIVVPDSARPTSATSRWTTTRSRRSAACWARAAWWCWTRPPTWCKFALRIMRFYAHESCGWCIPCREGTTWLRKILQRFDDGGGRHEDIALMGELSKNMLGRTFCALGDAAAMPTISIVEKFADDFEKRLARRSAELVTV